MKVVQQKTTHKSKGLRKTLVMCQLCYSNRFVRGLRASISVDWARFQSLYILPLAECCVWVHTWLYVECTYRDILAAKAECIYIVMYVLIAVYACALSVQCQVRRPYHVLHPYMKTRMYSYYNFAQTLLHGNNHLFTAVYTIIISTGNVVLYKARAA